MQEIPSDVLLLAIDYLDSPTLMNCREVSKTWLDVVDGNRSLYSFFYLPKDSKPFKQKMFELFNEKSVSGLRGISINQKVDNFESLIEFLLNSRSQFTLRYFFLDNLCKRSSFYPGGLSRMSNLYCLSYSTSSFERIHPRFKIRDGITHFSPSNSQDGCPLTILHLLDGHYRNYNSQALGWCSASLKHLAIMISGIGPFETLQFPNLQILELHCWGNLCTFSSESCPTLKAIYIISHARQLLSSRGLPVSLEKVWLNCNRSNLMTNAVSEMDLVHLDSSLPHLEELRFEKTDGSFDLILGSIKARRSAVEQGVDVDGIKMKPIKKITVEKESFSNQTWSELEDLVESLVDIKDALKVEEISV